MAGAFFTLVAVAAVRKNQTGCNPGGMQPVDWARGARQRDVPATVMRDLEGVAHPGVDPVVG